MIPVFADTSFYIAILNPADELHEKALAAVDRNARTIVTTEYVLVELANYFASRNRSLFMRLIEIARHDAETEIVPSSADLFERGVHLFASRQDKSWSLTDCISIVVMEDHGINAVLSSDRHFEQAGFHLLIPQG